MYVFLYKRTKLVYAYTKSKDIAEDYYDINKDRFDMLKVSKEAIKEGLSFPVGGNITYFSLNSDDATYMVPMTESEANTIISECLSIESRISYVYNEIVQKNKYGLNKKYLNIITELTSVLKKKPGDFLKKNNSKINSLKVYQDLRRNEV